MNKATSSKTKTRRPTTKRSSLSSTAKKAIAKKPVAKKSTTKKTVDKKTTAHKATSKKPVSKPTAKPKAAANKQAARKPVSRKPRTRQKQLISLPLGRFGSLTLQINQPASKPRRKQTTAAKKKAAKRRDTGKAVAIIVLGLCSSMFFGLRVFAAPSAPPIVKSTPQPAIIKPPEKKYMPASVPTHLRIPDIAVDTTLSQVDLAPDGSIAVPDPFLTAGWYKRSPTPGQEGPSIIVGHLDNIRGLAVFWRLRELIPGQQIQIERQDGTTVTFKVDKVEQFNPDSYPTADVYGNLNYAGLRLITCGGTFNRLTHGYDANTVVFASQVQAVL